MGAASLQCAVEARELSASLIRYRDLTGKTPEDVLLKVGGNLAGFVRTRLKTLTPAKGKIRADRLALLAQSHGRSRGSRRGLGVHVRPSVRAAILSKYGFNPATNEKRATLSPGRRSHRRLVYSRAVVFAKGGKGSGRLNLQQLMVERELNLRESGRGFLSISSRYPKTLGALQFAKSKYGPFLSLLGLNAAKDVLTLQWDPSRSPLQASAATGLSKPRAAAAVALAIRDTRADLEKYLTEKLNRNARAARLS